MRCPAALMIVGVLLVPQSARSEPHSWERVRRLAAGTEVTLECHGTAPVVGIVLAVDEGVLTLLRIDDPSLTNLERKTLRDVSATHSQYLLDAGPGRTFFIPPHVFVAEDAIRISDHNIGAVNELVIAAPRDLVTRIETTPQDRNPAGCAIASYYRGALIGALPGALIGGAIGRDSGPALAGLAIGWVVGGFRSYATCRHVPARVVYAEP
jgi:hypothetical protein